MNSFITAGNLLIHVLFDSYVIILLLRFILQKLNVGWHNPLSQFILQLTDKPLQPLRKIIPLHKGFDFSVLILAIVLQYIEVILLWWLQAGMFPNISGTLIITVGELLSKVIYVYVYAIIINALTSWVPTLQSHPLMHIIRFIVDPLLTQVRRVIPLIAGIDISPIPAILGLTLINLLIVTPILNLGARFLMG